MSHPMRIAAFSITSATALFCLGCGAEERGPLLAGGREVKSWVADLKSPNAKVRRQAVLKLGNVADADPSVAPALIDALGDKDPLVRHDALMAAVKLKSPANDLINTIQAMAAGDKNKDVRESAGKALKKLGKTE